MDMTLKSQSSEETEVIVARIIASALTTNKKSEALRKIIIFSTLPCSMLFMICLATLAIIYISATNGLTLLHFFTSPTVELVGLIGIASAGMLAALLLLLAFRK